jgi:hypothetical protein
MRNWLSDSAIPGITVAAGLVLAATLTTAQTPPYRAPRTADGRPNLNGIWQALNTANWDLQGHAAAKGPVPSLGAVFVIPPGLGVVEGDEIRRSVTSRAYHEPRISRIPFKSSSPSSKS